MPRKFVPRSCAVGVFGLAFAAAAYAAEPLARELDHSCDKAIFPLSSEILTGDGPVVPIDAVQQHNPQLLELTSLEFGAKVVKGDVRWPQ